MGMVSQHTHGLSISQSERKIERKKNTLKEIDTSGRNIIFWHIHMVFRKEDGTKRQTNLCEYNELFF